MLVMRKPMRETPIQIDWCSKKAAVGTNERIVTKPSSEIASAEISMYQSMCANERTRASCLGAAILFLRLRRADERDDVDASDRLLKRIGPRERDGLFFAGVELRKLRLRGGKR